jgi:glycerate 2-kinase
MAAGLAHAPAPAVLVSMGTDGIDGPTDAAGALVDPTTLLRAGARGLDHPDTYLDRNDSAAFFDPLGDLLRPGPTGTNVGDLQVLLVGPA